MMQLTPKRTKLKCLKPQEHTKSYCWRIDQAYDKKIWEYERVRKADQRAKKWKLEHNAKLIEGKRKQQRKTWIDYISTPMMKSIKAQETLNIYYRRIEDQNKMKMTILMKSMKLGRE